MLKDKSILITGGNGFLGKHLVKALIEEEGVEKDKIFTPKSSEYDLRKEEDVAKMFAKINPEIIVHMASTSKGMEYNKEHPATLYFDHIMMSALLFHYSVKYKVKKIAVIGTALIYPASAEIPIDESSLWTGPCESTIESLGVLNRAIITQAKSYRKEFGLNSIYIIPANLYGPGDHFSSTHSHVIPATIQKFQKAIIENKPSVEIWGTGKASREFLYVKDAARAIIECLKSYDKAEILNLGSGQEVKIIDLVNEISSLMKYNGNILWDSTKPEGVLRRCLNSTLMKKEINFTPKTSFKEGIKETVEWYLKENHKF